MSVSRINKLKYLLGKISDKRKEKILKDLSCGAKEIYQKEHSYVHVKNYLYGRLLAQTKKIKPGIKMQNIGFDYLIAGDWFYFKTFNIETTDVYLKGRINLGEETPMDDPSYKNYGTIEKVT
jgi:hypothetical protein